LTPEKTWVENKENIDGSSFNNNSVGQILSENELLKKSKVTLEKEIDRLDQEIRRLNNEISSKQTCQQQPIEIKATQDNGRTSVESSSNRAR
jgi:valyl-tRNA synthetase